MSEETTKVEQEKLTPEQVEANRIKVINYYKAQAEVLSVQSEYERLMAEIETHRAKRMEMIIRQAQMQAPPEEEEEKKATPSTEVKEPKERKLKKA